MSVAESFLDETPLIGDCGPPRLRLQQRDKGGTRRSAPNQMQITEGRPRRSHGLSGR